MTNGHAIMTTGPQAAVLSCNQEELVKVKRFPGEGKRKSLMRNVAASYHYFGFNAATIRIPPL